MDVSSKEFKNLIQRIKSSGVDNIILNNIREYVDTQYKHNRRMTLEEKEEKKEKMKTLYIQLRNNNDTNLYKYLLYYTGQKKLPAHVHYTTTQEQLLYGILSFLDDNSNLNNNSPTRY